MYKNLNLRYPDPQGYHAIDQYGQLRWVSTPFTVSCIDPVGSIRENELFTIEKVALTPSNDLVFIIENEAYPNCNFMVAMPDFW